MDTDHTTQSLTSLNTVGAADKLLKNFNHRRHRSLVDKPTAVFWTGSLDEVSSSNMKPDTISESSVDVTPRTSTPVDSSSSPFRTLNPRNLRAAMRAMTGKLRNSHHNSKRKIEIVRPSVQPNVNGGGSENRVSSCQKELDVCLRYLQDVVNKEKLVMLPGSANIVLDTVLKLLLVLNEKRLKPTTTTVSSLQHNSENSSLLSTYNDVYNCLAVLLKYADKLVVAGKVDATNDRTKIASLIQSLKDAIQKLIKTLAGNNKNNNSNTINQSKKPILDRTYSLESQASSGSSDLCSDKEDLDLLCKLDQVNNNSNGKKFERSYSIPEYDPTKPPPKPPHPTVLLFNHKAAFDTASESGTTGSYSPPSADSGVESFTTDGNNCNGEPILPTAQGQDVSFLSLDELFSKLNLTNNNMKPDWPANEFRGSDGNLIIASSPVLNITNQHTNNHQLAADEQTTSEQKEELCGNTLIKTTKTTTKQFVKHTVVKTQQAVLQANGDECIDVLKQLKAKNNNEIKFKETENLKLSGGECLELMSTAPKFPMLTLDLSGKKTTNKLNLNCSMDSSLTHPASGILSARKKTRPVSDYENFDGLRTVTVQQNLVQQSSSIQSFSRHAMVNGKIVAQDSTEKINTSLIKASKSDTFRNGSLTDRKGSGSLVEESQVKRSCKLANDQSGDQPDCSSVACSGPKANVVSSYVKIFGSCQPDNPSDFRAVSLASYINIRDKWMLHEESNKKKAFTFQFPNSGRNQSPTMDKQPWMDLDKSATAPHTMSTKGGRTDYQNLMELLELNDRLKFPHRLGIERGPTPKPLPFRQNAALTYVNYLEELDVSRFLFCKKENEDGPEIRGGAVDVLTVYATKNAGLQKGSFYQEAFLTTYRTFVSPLELLIKLIYRYEKFTLSATDNNDLERNKIAKNTFSLLVCVVDDLSPADLTDEVLGLISEFLFRLVSAGELNLSRYLRQRLTNRYQAKQDFNAELGRALFSPYSPGSLRNITVLDFKSNLLAEQFTYLDWFYFKKIELSELLLWAQQQTEEHSPNLTSFTVHFNNMSYWVRTRILRCNDAKEREMIFAKFLKVMNHLRHLGNFNSLFAMLSALDSGSIRRLDWPKWLTDGLAEYTGLTDSSQSFKSYRVALAETRPPCLPYIGIILQDLTFVHIGNPNMLPEDHCGGRVDVVNFAKRWQQYTILDNMRRFKAWPYNMKKSEQVLAFINEFEDHLSEDDLWERSETIKPRGVTTKR